MYRPADWEEQKAAIFKALMFQEPDMDLFMDMAADAIVKSLFLEGRNVPCGYEEPGHLVFISNKMAFGENAETEVDTPSGC